MAESVKYALKKLFRTPEGQLKYYYIDMKTGKILSSLEGYVLWQQGQDFNKRTKEVVNKPVSGDGGASNGGTSTGKDGSDAPDRSSPIGGISGNVSQSRTVSSGPSTGRTLSSRTGANNYNYIERTLAPQIARVVPMTAGPANLIEAARRANNISAINAARRDLGLPEMSVAEKAKALAKDNYGYVGDVVVGNNQYAVSLDPSRIAPDNRSTFSPQTIKEEVERTGQPARMATEEEVASAKEKAKENGMSGWTTLGETKLAPEQIPERNPVEDKLNLPQRSTVGLDPSLFPDAPQPVQAQPEDKNQYGVSVGAPLDAAQSTFASYPDDTGSIYGAGTSRGRGYFAGLFGGFTPTPTPGLASQQRQAEDTSQRSTSSQTSQLGGISSTQQPSTQTNSLADSISAMERGRGMRDIGAPTVANVEQNQQNASHRPGDISPSLAENIGTSVNNVLGERGGFSVTSGTGEFGKAPHRESTNPAHDGFGRAADGFITYDGKPVTDQNVIGDVLADFAARNPETSGVGFGQNYMGDKTVHMDVAGRAAQWGEDGKSKNMMRDNPEMYSQIENARATGVSLPSYLDVEPTQSPRASQAMAQTTNTTPTTTTVEQSPAQQAQAQTKQNLEATKPNFSFNAADISLAAYALAGELSPSKLRDLTSEDKNKRQQAINEAANMLATMENRYNSKVYENEKDRLAKTLNPAHYNSLQPEHRQVTRNNFTQFGEALKNVVKDYATGALKPTLPEATHYRADYLDQPKWEEDSIFSPTQVGDHIFSRASLPGMNQAEFEGSGRAFKDNLLGITQDSYDSMGRGGLASAFSNPFNGYFGGYATTTDDGRSAFSGFFDNAGLGRGGTAQGYSNPLGGFFGGYGDGAVGAPSGGNSSSPDNSHTGGSSGPSTSGNSGGSPSQTGGFIDGGGFVDSMGGFWGDL